jgi:hypothetical protein
MLSTGGAEILQDVLTGKTMDAISFFRFVRVRRTLMFASAGVLRLWETPFLVLI